VVGVEVVAGVADESVEAAGVVVVAAVVAVAAVKGVAVVVELDVVVAAAAAAAEVDVAAEPAAVVEICEPDSFAWFDVDDWDHHPRSTLHAEDAQAVLADQTNYSHQGIAAPVISRVKECHSVEVEIRDLL